jgi:zinc protease
MINRIIAPPIVDAVHFDLHLKPYEKFTLDNGVDVYAINAGAEEVMAIEWVFFAGNCFEEQNLVAASANFLLRNGTSKKTAFEINEHFEYFGSYLNRSCQHETAGITLHSLTKHIGELLPAVKELIMDSTMPPAELAIYQQNMKQRLRVSLKKSDFVAGRLIDASLFGEHHPYGKFSSAEAFDAVQQEQLLDFYKKHYQQGRFVLFVAGKLPANLETLLNKNFGDLPNNKMNVNSAAIQPATQKKSRVTNDPEGVQGAIRIARPFPNRHHPDFLKTQVLNSLFGGFFGSRLMSNIREDKGYTYGIHSYLQNHVQESAWMIATEAGKDVCEATIVEIYKEMKNLRETPVGEDELSLVKNYMMGTILGELDGPFQIISRWKNILLNNLDESYFYNALATIKKITAEELQELANKYLLQEEFYELVVV